LLARDMPVKPQQEGVLYHGCHVEGPAMTSIVAGYTRQVHSLQSRMHV
jgi:hypothetical protein